MENEVAYEMVLALLEYVLFAVHEALANLTKELC
jgi:hypothetical protein